MAGNGSAEEVGIGNIMQRPMYRQSKKLRFDLRDKSGCPERVLYKGNTVIRSHDLCQGTIHQSYSNTAWKSKRDESIIG